MCLRPENTHNISEALACFARSHILRLHNMYIWIRLGTWGGGGGGGGLAPIAKIWLRYTDVSDAVSPGKYDLGYLGK